MASAILLVACSTTPITVSSTSTPLFPQSSGAAVVAPQSAAAGQPAMRASGENAPGCVVRIADVRDLRTDPNDLGMMGLRVVKTADSVAWLRNALVPLEQDHRLHFIDDAKDGALVLRIELVKAYIMTMNTQKSANVVLRVALGRDGKDLGSDIARGRDTGANWVNGEDEAQGALNRALSAAVLELDQRIVDRCQAAG